MRGLEENLGISGMGLCRRWQLRRALDKDWGWTSNVRDNTRTKGLGRAEEGVERVLEKPWGGCLKMVAGMSIFVSERSIGS